MTPYNHYPTKFKRLVYKLLLAMEEVSDFCGDNDEPELANFFWFKNGFDGLRSYIDVAIDVAEPRFNGQTESRGMKLQLAVERGQRRRKRQTAKLKKSK